MLLPERSLSTGVDNSLRTLIVQNLPHDIRSRELWNLFRQFPGFSGSALMVKRCGTSSSKAGVPVQQQQQRQWLSGSDCNCESPDDVDNCAGLEAADAVTIGEYSLFNRPEAVRVVGLVTFDCHSQAKHALSVIDGVVFDYRTPNVALFVRFSKTNPTIPLCPSDVPRSCLFYQFSRTVDARTFSTVPSFAPQPYRSVSACATPCCRTLFLCNIADGTSPSELHAVLAQFVTLVFSTCIHWHTFVVVVVVVVVNRVRGFVALRMDSGTQGAGTQGRRRVAFAKFDRPENAERAVKLLQGLLLPAQAPSFAQKRLRVEFARSEMASGEPSVSRECESVLAAPPKMDVALQHYNGDTYYYM